MDKKSFINMVKSLLLDENLSWIKDNEFKTKVLKIITDHKNDYRILVNVLSRKLEAVNDDVTFNELKAFNICLSFLLFVKYRINKLSKISNYEDYIDHIIKMNLGKITFYQTIKGFDFEVR